MSEIWAAPECEITAGALIDRDTANAVFAVEFRKLAAAWRAKKVRHAEKAYELVGEVFRAQGRLKYRKECEAMGRTVRPYNRDTSKTGYRGAEANKRVANRDRQRELRGVTKESVRTYTDLSAMSAEELAAYQRAKANERKAAQRARDRKLKTDGECDLTAVLDQTEIDEILAELEM
ncbi:hypothetical protein IP69_00120 [Bosea sp. AAP35]|uniref:hypothetical protein n=1 Tax=Bosea sp. AAP35 TaxID=1523417 RepID=UPI0006B992B7|nr:hypothetical protein [Bosea sp. AAP35]KPF73219.1 hypothetical protein IP69_00120 [Bosea sp. AAP35]